MIKDLWKKLENYSKLNSWEEVELQEKNKELKKRIEELEAKLKNAGN